jgi:uncharacterized protein
MEVSRGLLPGPRCTNRTAGSGGKRDPSIGLGTRIKRPSQIESVRFAMRHQQFWWIVYGAILIIVVFKPGVSAAETGDKNQDLRQACVAGSVKDAERLLSAGADVNSRHADRKTPVILAGQNGRSDVLRLLLDRGAEVDAVDNHGRTALIWASIQGHDTVVDILLDEGATIDVRDHQGTTALMWAAIKGKEAATKVLLARGAGVNAVDKDGRTALMLAAFAANVNIVKMLLEEGADREAKDTGDASAYDYAVKKGNQKVKELLGTSPK